MKGLGSNSFLFFPVPPVVLWAFQIAVRRQVGVFAVGIGFSLSSSPFVEAVYRLPSVALSAATLQMQHLHSHLIVALNLIQPNQTKARTLGDVRSIDVKTG